MLSWNRTLKIYRATGRRANATHVQKYEEVSTEKKLEILNFVKTHGMGQAQKKYNKASSTIQTWNAELGVYRPRTHRTFTPEQKDKIIQFADSTSIAEAAKQFHLYSHQIQRWIDDKKRTTEK
jgi:transposase-like protein